MMRWIISSGMKFGRLAVAAALAILALGVFQLRGARVDAYPQFTPPTVQIQTEALGLSAGEVEQLITVPLEQDLLNGIPWLDTIQSRSMTGLSAIDLVFKPGTNLLDARQMTQERLSQAHALPNVGSPPVMLPPLSSTTRTMMVSLSSTTLSAVDVSVLARWKIRPKLLGLPGVANVAIWGQRDRQLQVQVDPNRLAARGITLNDVIDATGNSLWVSPLTFVEASTPGTGGFIDTPNQRLGVQHIFPITTAKQLSAVSIETTDGSKLSLADVATVVEGNQPLIGDAIVNGNPALMLVIEKFPEANTLEVTRAVKDALTEMSPGLSGIQVDTTVFQPTNFVRSALRNVGLALLIGLLLVTLLIGVVRRSWRAAVIALLTLPLSLIAAASVLHLRGVTITTMTLAGFMVALAVTVDDLVIDTDAIRRQLRENYESDTGRTNVNVVTGALLEMRGPVIYATLVVLIALLPVLALTGLGGSFGRPLVVSYTLAVLASMAVSLLVTPALALLLHHRVPPPVRPTRPLSHWTRSRVDNSLRRSIATPRRAYAFVALLVLAGLALLPQLGNKALLPTLQDRDLLVSLNTAAGTSLTETDRITTAVSAELSKLPEVHSIGMHVGRAVTADQIANVNSAQLWVNITKAADLSATTAAMGRILDGYPGVHHTISNYAQNRLDAANTQIEQPVVVRVYGQDLNLLQTKAQEISRALSTVPGIVNPRAQLPTQEPSLRVEVNLTAAQKYGISPGNVRRATATLLSGLPVGSLYEDQKIFDVVVWGTPASRSSVSSAQNLLIDAPNGGHVRLKDVASVRVDPYPTAIIHHDVSRSIDVLADVNGRSVSDVLTDVRTKLQAVPLPLEYHTQVLSDEITKVNDDQRTLVIILVVIVGIFLIFQAASGSWRIAALLFGMLPLAVVGGVLMALAVGGLMSLGALLGLLTVVGIAARSNLLLVRRFQNPDLPGTAITSEQVLHGTQERLTPIALAAGATAVVLLPFAVLGNIPGLEILHPLAIVTLGGLVTSTLVTLFVLPTLFFRFNTRPPTIRDTDWLDTPDHPTTTDSEETVHVAH